MFLELMLAVSNTKTQKFFAHFYYKCVRLYWDYFFNYK